MTGVLVHEWIAQRGGSENVFEALAGIYPDADLVCLWNDSTGRFDASRLRETALARTPLRRSKALALPFMPAVWRRQPGAYDWALISSHLFAHHARFAGEAPGFERFVYVHSPARYIWTPELDGRGASLPVRALSRALKPLDRRRAHETTQFAANSAFVRERIASTWEVESRVIHPPVEVTAIQAVPDWAPLLDAAEAAALEALPASFVLGASRFIPYKDLGTVIGVGETLGLPVVLAGDGPELPALRARAATAGVPVHFVLAPSSALLRALFARTTLYVFPAIEDFGIMPVEAMAAGAPVLAQSFGGAAESVVPGRTGGLTDFRSPADVRAAAETAIATARADRVAHAREFSAERFAERIREWTGR